MKRSTKAGRKTALQMMHRNDRKRIAEAVRIRFAAANRLCVNLHYQNTWRLIEPYSLRRSKEGHLLLYAVKHESGEPRSYRVDRIQGVEASTTPFVPRYLIELTPAGPLHAPATTRRLVSTARPIAAQPRRARKAARHGSDGPTYIFKCTVCGKSFRRKSYDAALNPHKNKQGYSCYGSFATYVRTEY